MTDKEEIGMRIHNDEIMETAKRRQIEATEVLKELGDNTMAIWRSLEKLGIKGRRGSCEECPIARYLAFKGFLSARVQISAIFLGEATWIYVAYPVTEFILAFDDGSFSNLREED